MFRGMLKTIVMDYILYSSNVLRLYIFRKVISSSLASLFSSLFCVPLVIQVIGSFIYSYCLGMKELPVSHTTNDKIKGNS